MHKNIYTVHKDFMKNVTRLYYLNGYLYLVCVCVRAFNIKRINNKQ